MNMNKLQHAASLMGKTGRGKKKTLTDEERYRRSLWMREVQKKRWLQKGA